MEAKDGHAIAERLQRIEDVGLEAVLAEEAEVAEQLAEARCADSRARRLKKMEEEGTEVVREHERRLGRRTYRRNAEAQRERARDRRRAGDAGYAALRNRTPPWLTPEELEEMDSIYESRVREGTNPEEVDHVFPIKAHPTLTGTHVPWNLQVLTRTLNNQRQQTRRNGFTCTDDEAELYIACGMAIRRADMAPGGQVDWSRYPRPSDELIEAARRQISASSG